MSSGIYAIYIIVLAVLAAAARWMIHLILEKHTGRVLPLCIGGLVLAYTIATVIVCSMAANLAIGASVDTRQVYLSVAVTFVLMNIVALFLILMYVSAVRKR